jgi:hypothetical protein
LCFFQRLISINEHQSDFLATLAMFTKESILKIAENLNLRALSEIFQLLKTLLLVFSSLGVLLLIVVVQHRIRVLHISHISHIP